MSSRPKGRGGRNPKDMPREQQVSRKVSWLLRHGAGQEGLVLGKGGYVSVRDALNTRALKALNITFPELKAIVEANDKQRFSMIPVSSLAATDCHATPPETTPESSPLPTTPKFSSEDPADYLIRANQGHSIKVDDSGLLTPITAEAGNIPSTCVHGTDEKSWNLIIKSGGLRRMGRNHIHFASGIPASFKSVDADAAGDEKEALPVISGMRNSSTVLIYVDVKAALEAGIKFFVSENGVVLSEGNEEGFLPYAFFKRVESRKKDGGVLMRDGVLPEGVVVDVEEWKREVGDSARGGKGKRGGRGGRGGGERGRGGKANLAKGSDDSKDLPVDA